jgi:hypothetical protein
MGASLGLRRAAVSVLVLVAAAAVVSVSAPAQARTADAEIALAFGTAQPGGQADVLVDCPDGTVATGGGFLNPSGLSAGAVRIAMSRPFGNSWQVVAFNPTTAAEPVGAYAVCAAVADRELVTAVKQVDPGAQGDVLAGCPTGKAATGGGFVNPAALSAAGAAQIAMNRPFGTAWQVLAFNATDAPQSVLAVAVCAPVAGRQVTTAVGTARPGAQVDVIATCPAQKSVTGGGFVNHSGISAATGVTVAMSRPVGDAWQVVAFNPTTTPRAVMSFAVCVTG